MGCNPYFVFCWCDGFQIIKFKIYGCHSFADIDYGNIWFCRFYLCHCFDCKKQRPSFIDIVGDPCWTDHDSLDDCGNCISTLDRREKYIANRERGSLYEVRQVNGLGLALFILIMIVEMLVTLPLGSPGSEAPDAMRSYLAWEFLLSAIPAGLLTFGAAMLLKLSTQSDRLQASVIWTVIHLLLMLAIAVGNQNVGLIFGSYAFYIRMAFIFAGPLIVLKRKTLIIINCRQLRVFRLRTRYALERT